MISGVSHRICNLCNFDLVFGVSNARIPTFAHRTITLGKLVERALGGEDLALDLRAAGD